MAGFVALVFAVLSFNAFIANDLSRQSSGNRLVAMLTDLYGWLVGTLGAMPTGVLFAVCAVAILVLAARDGKGMS
ncbi:hypothetical protein ACSFA7_32425 [Variovorax sp. LT1R20]